MINKLVILLVLLFPLVSAVCEEGQIDINSATVEKLQDITHVGPKVAEYIIEQRPFNSIEDLVEVKYISIGYVEEIKNEELACVCDEQIKQEEVVEEKEEEQKDKPIKEFIEISEIKTKKIPIKIENKVIELSPQNIKSEDYNKSLSKEDYAKYGLGLFCVLLFGLFAIKKYKPRKNEFR